MEESNQFRFNSATGIKNKFGWEHGNVYKIQADKTKIPLELEIFIPYIDFFYVADQEERERIMKEAPLESLILLENLVKVYEVELNNYLGGEDSYIQETTNEYRALTELREMSETYMYFR